MDEYLTLQTALDKRAKAANEIHQGSSSLCGPASFMYCIVKRQPEEYVRYVLNLARIGEGHLGRMRVKPGNACTYQVDPASEIGKWIDPVDWVALASLRDAYNSAAGMCEIGAQFSGITFPKDIARWFNDTGWFNADHFWSPSEEKGPSNSSSVTPRNEKLKNHLLDLLDHLGNGDICLLVSNKIADGIIPSGPKPDHWIVLHGTIRIAGLQTPVARRTPQVTMDDLWKKTISFRFWTWGRNLNDATLAAHQTTFTATVQDFLSCYFGYVSADPV